MHVKLFAKHFIILKGFIVQQKHCFFIWIFTKIISFCYFSVIFMSDFAKDISLLTDVKQKTDALCSGSLKTSEWEAHSKEDLRESLPWARIRAVFSWLTTVLPNYVLPMQSLLNFGSKWAWIHLMHLMKPQRSGHLLVWSSHQLSAHDIFCRDNGYRLPDFVLSSYKLQVLMDWPNSHTQTKISAKRWMQWCKAH